MPSTRERNGYWGPCLGGRFLGVFDGQQALAQGPSSGRVESAKPLKLVRHDSAGMASSASGPRRLLHGPDHSPGRVDG